MRGGHTRQAPAMTLKRLCLALVCQTLAIRFLKCNHQTNQYFVGGFLWELAEAHAADFSRRDR
jgi:hypothetical protein